MTRTAILIGILTVLVHLQGVVVGDGWGEFFYDDRRFIELNPAVKSVQAPWAYLEPRTAAVDGWEGIYRPLRTLSFAIDWAILGERPKLWRLESVLLHGLAAALLAVLLFRLTERAWAAGLGALVFGFHPLTAEVSSWISSRGDVLALVGALAAALFHMRGRWIAAAVAFFLALLGKSMVVTLPALLLLVEAARGRRPLRDRASLRAYGSLAAVAVGFVFLRWWELRDAFGQEGLDAWMTRRGAGFLHDVRGTLLPAVLGFDRHLEGSWLTSVAAVAVVLTIVGAAVILWERGRPLAGAGLAWFLVALVPVSLPFFPLKIATADRFLYVSLAGLGLTVAAVLARIEPRRRDGAIVGCGLVVMLLGALTFARTEVYASERALWTEALRIDEDNPRAVDGLGWAALRAGDLVTARRQLEIYVDRVPHDPRGHMNLAQVYQGIGRERHARREDPSVFVRLALKHYREAIQIWESGAASGSDVLYPEACLRSARLALAVPDVGRAEADARAAIEAGDERAEDVLRDVILNYLIGEDLDGAERAARALAEARDGVSPRVVVRDLRIRYERNLRKGAAPILKMEERLERLQGRLE